MSSQLKHWLSCNNVRIDEIGRIIIDDKEVISEINGAVSVLALEDAFGNAACGAGCDSGCTGCDASDGF